MCGRFVGYRTLEELKRHFPIDGSACDITASYNVAPSQEILVIVRHEGENRLEKYHWGLVPFWAKDLSIGNRMINARAETLTAKPAFRQAFRKRRCLIPADGFYEWKGDKGRKRPFFLTLPDEGPFAFAGLWETWHDPEGSGSTYRSCAIITRPASDSVRPVHHRMPLIIDPEKYNPWLDPANQDVDLLREIMDRWMVSELKIVPVSPRVNRVVNNDPANIQPLSQMEIDFEPDAR